MVLQRLIRRASKRRRFISDAIAHYSAMPDVMAWKLAGAGGGGYLALVVRDAKVFLSNHSEAIELHIRRD